LTEVYTVYTNRERARLLGEQIHREDDGGRAVALIEIEAGVGA
jgi:hypothetical protein